MVDGVYSVVEFEPITFGDCGDVLTCQTEAFRRDNCDKSIKLDGTISRDTGLDCYGRYYGGLPEGSLTESNSFAYNTFRIAGSFEQTCETPVVETSDGGAVLSSHIEQTWLLRTEGLPKAVAQRVASVIMTNNYQIEGESMDVPGDICKNNDEGSLWYLESTFTRKTCESNPCN